MVPFCRDIIFNNHTTSYSRKKVDTVVDKERSTELAISSLLRRGFGTAKIKAREASARFLTQYGVEPGGDTMSENSDSRKVFHDKSRFLTI